MLKLLDDLINFKLEYDFNHIIKNMFFNAMAIALPAGAGNANPYYPLEVNETIELLKSKKLVPYHTNFIYYRESTYSNMNYFIPYEYDPPLSELLNSYDKLKYESAIKDIVSLVLRESLHARGGASQDINDYNYRHLDFLTTENIKILAEHSLNIANSINTNFENNKEMDKCISIYNRDYQNKLRKIFGTLSIGHLFNETEKVSINKETIKLKDYALYKFNGEYRLFKKSNFEKFENNNKYTISETRNIVEIDATYKFPWENHTGSIKLNTIKDFVSYELYNSQFYALAGILANIFKNDSIILKIDLLNSAKNVARFNSALLEQISNNFKTIKLKEIDNFFMIYKEYLNTNLIKPVNMYDFGDFTGRTIHSGAGAIFSSKHDFKIYETNEKGNLIKKNIFYDLCKSETNPELIEELIHAGDWDGISIVTNKNNKYFNFNENILKLDSIIGEFKRKVNVYCIFNKGKIKIIPYLYYSDKEEKKFKQNRSSRLRKQAFTIKDYYNLYPKNKIIVDFDC